MLDEDTGMILGLPDEELCEKLYVVTMQMDLGARSEPITLLCQLRLEMLAAPAVFGYPRIEKCVDVAYQNQVHFGLEPCLFGSPVNKINRRSSPFVEKGVRKKPLPPPEFIATPFVNGGFIDRYEVDPPMPLGMEMDEHTGVIRGVPELRGGKMYAKTFEITGHNSVGTSTCQISIEMIIGSWHLANVKFISSVEPPEEEEQSSIEMTEEADTCDEAFPLGYEPGTGSAQLSPWLQKGKPVEFTQDAVEKCGSIVEASGKSLQIKEAGGVDGIRSVRGLQVSELATHLGIGDDVGAMRRLVHAIEQKGHRCPQLHERGFKLAISGEDAVSAGEAVVYLGRAAGIPRGVLPAEATSLPAVADFSRPNARGGMVEDNDDELLPSSPSRLPGEGECDVIARNRQRIKERSDAHASDMEQCVATIKNARIESPLRQMFRKPMHFQVDSSRQINEEFAKQLPFFQMTIQAKGKAPRKPLDRSLLTSRRN